MTIYLGSRYENSVVDFISPTPQPEFVAPTVFYEFTGIGQISYVEYVWKTGDRLDKVAFDFYKRPELWWLLAEYNPEIEDPQNITAGTRLRIPNA